jgi:ribosomal protein L29
MNKSGKRVKEKKYFAKYYKSNKKWKGNLILDTQKQEELTKLQNNIKEIQLSILDFQFKKATRQPIKPHEIKVAKKQRARLITRYWEIYSTS